MEQGVAVPDISKRLEDLAEESDRQKHRLQEFERISERQVNVNSIAQLAQKAIKEFKNEFWNLSIAEQRVILDKIVIGI